MKYLINIFQITRFCRDCVARFLLTFEIFYYRYCFLKFSKLYNITIRCKIIENILNNCDNSQYKVFQK